MSVGAWVGLAVVAVVAVVAAYDLLQRGHAILRNFPVIGHLRYMLESFGPELRQYIVTGNDEERPFTRDQRRWVYASAKRQNNYFGFGTDNDLERDPELPDHQARRVSACREPAAGDGTGDAVPRKVMGARVGAGRRFAPPRS